ncbi:hypothetical protein [Pontibacter liquoris]|uniref:hypothetical protein n=1 Tax=Pontibacter liquoris TaxID=2905677 RepID=UPI001FA7BEC2|nr:hypothetical protein [Pontibacter liquoris]
MRLKPFLSILLLTLLLGCDTEKESAPVPEPTPTTKTFDFSYRYDPDSPEIKEFELAISQKDGKVLLDTLLATGKDHALKVKSKDAKFDFTTIYFNPALGRYSVATYIQVNKNQWHIDETSKPVVRGATEPATIYYSNMPNDALYHFESKQPGSWVAIWDTDTQTIKYRRLLPNDLVYMWVPGYKKYMFTEVTSAETYVDFSKANVAEVRKFVRPAGVTNLGVTLFGYTKAGDPNSKLLLYFPFLPSKEYDLQFPSTVIEQFDLYIGYTDAGGYFHSYHHIGQTIPTAMDFAATSDFTVIKSEIDDFQIQIGKDKPDRYFTFWQAEQDALRAQWYIYFPTDDTALKPKTFLENLKTKSLAGKDLSLFRPKNVYSEKALTSSVSGASQSRFITKTFK